ncbi:hypothetical protein TRFO_35551 [Tritrichomonas foetus]|uniref:Uncharacterized protein n=1 Tax=Tritrichomonas foetus TaxID=1144522 RepID=A0A1J4JG19_9EUKA|nr:hypothetical protein TRFO_35551 [Tritrichomonas foetus]|eukprot:OHS98088.1 hypothetical protein TRFO_35551 [Tritrichomonas foetus]
MEAINRAKEEQERQRMVEEMLARKRHEEEEEEEEEELENQRRNLKRVSMGHNDFEENQELNKELQNHHESLKLKLQRRRSAGTPTSKTQNLSEQNQEPQSAENNTLNEQSTPNHQGEDFDINQEHQNQSQNYGKDKVEGDKGVNEEIEDIYKHRRMATLSQFIMKPSSMKTEKTTPNFDLDQIMETTNNGIEMKRRKSLAPVLSNHGRSSSNFNSNSPSRPESRASNSSSPKLSRHNSKVMFGEDEIDNSDKVLSPSRSKSNEFNLRLKRSTTPPKLPIVKRPLRKSDTNDEDDFELFDGLAGNEEEDDELLRVFKEERKRILQQQKEFEEKMAEEKKNKAEEEKRRIEEENRKMEEERKKKAEEEKRRIEEENRKMAEEKKKKAEEEKRRIEEENRKLEEEKKKKAEEEKRRIEDEERKNKELEEKEKSEKEKLLKGNKDLEIKQAEAEIEKDLNLINDDDIDDLDENALNEILKGSELDDEINDEDTLEADLRMEGYQEFLEKFPGKEDDDVLCQAYVDEYVKNHMKK